MLTLVRQIGLRRSLEAEALPLSVALVITEVFCHFQRSLMSLLLCRPKNSTPLVVLTFSFFLNVNALTRNG
jgi:hypothetical protein